MSETVNNAIVADTDYAFNKFFNILDECRKRIEVNLELDHTSAMEVAKLGITRKYANELNDLVQRILSNFNNLDEESKKKYLILYNNNIKIIESIKLFNVDFINVFLKKIEKVLNT